MIGETTSELVGPRPISGMLKGSVKEGVVVRNLPPNARLQDIKDLLSRSGTVLAAKIMFDPEINRSLEWAAVQFDTAAQAKRAVEQFNGYSWQSRMLEVSEAEINQAFLLSDYDDTDKDSVESGIEHQKTSSLDWATDLEDEVSRTPAHTGASCRTEKNPFRSPTLSSAEPRSLSSPRPLSTELRNKSPDVPSQSNILPNASHISLEGNNNLSSAGRNIYNIKPSVTFSVQTDSSQSIGPSSSIMASSASTIVNNSTFSSFDFLVREGEHESETYARLLLPKKHGWPLWLPRPLRNLPEAYRKRGIDIGDVGIITTTGEFDFFFNICLPANDPINRNSVPDNFEHISHPENSEDVSFDPEEWMPGDYVVTSSVSEQASIRAIDDPTLRSPNYQFIASAPAGALLLMPRGGSRKDLLNTAPFIAYAKKHGPSWYKHINGTRGRGAANGSVYLITGVDKTQVWGTGVYSRLARDVISDPLTFRQVDTEDRDSGSKYEYVWTRSRSGFATTKYGPMKEFFDGSSELPYNQCAFLRGFRVALNESIWSSLIRGGVEVSPIQNISPDSLLQTGNDSYSSRSGSSAVSNYFGLSGGGYSGTGKTRATGSASEVGESVTIISKTPAPSMTLHPSDIINFYLLQGNKHAEVAITHDSVWCAVVDENATVLPNPEDMLFRIKEMYQPVYSDGGISLEPKDANNANSSQSLEVPHSKESRQGSKHQSQTETCSSSGDSSWGGGEFESTSGYPSLYGHIHLSSSTFSESTSDLNSISDSRKSWSYISDDRASTVETNMESSEEPKESARVELRHNIQGKSTGESMTSTASDQGIPCLSVFSPTDRPRRDFTLLVAGCKGGKTSFLRLLLDTSNISQTATQDQLASVAKFVQGCNSHTSGIRHTSIDINLNGEGSVGPDPVELHLVDTAAVDFAGDEKTAEWRVSEILRHVDGRFADCVESDWNSQWGDRFVHLCIYFLDPDQIMPPTVPGAVPLVPRTRNNSFSHTEPDTVILEPPLTTNPLLLRPTLPPAEIETIRRLSSRVNVLPVISRADALSNDRLAAVKVAIRRDLAEAGIGFGIFDVDHPYQSHTTKDSSGKSGDGLNGYNRSTNGTSSSNTTPPTSPVAPVNLRLPYALISPDIYSHSDGVARPMPSRHELAQQYAPSHHHTPGPRIPRGKYIRSYRWGALDVLDPSHSDFITLRAAIFHHMETLQKYTRDYLFDRFRTEYLRQQQPSSRHSISHRIPHGGPTSHPSRPILAIDTARPGHHQTTLSASRDVLNVDPNPTSSGNKGPEPSSTASARGTLRGSGSAKQRTKKITVACNFCRSRKLKCDGQRPACGQCVKRGNPCDYVHQNKRRATIVPRKAGDESEGESDSSEERSVELDGPSLLPQIPTQPLSRGVHMDKARDVHIPPPPRPIESRDDILPGPSSMRPDNELLHIATLSLPTVPGKSARQFTSSGPKVVACNFCRARKTKCDGAHPACASCARRSLPCNYVHDSGNGAQGPKKGRRASVPKPHTDSPHSLSPPSSRLVPTPSTGGGSIFDPRVPDHRLDELELKRNIDYPDINRPAKKMRMDGNPHNIP